MYENRQEYYDFFEFEVETPEEDILTVQAWVFFVEEFYATDGINPPYSLCRATFSRLVLDDQEVSYEFLRTRYSILSEEISKAQTETEFQSILEFLYEKNA